MAEKIGAALIGIIAWLIVSAVLWAPLWLLACFARWEWINPFVSFGGRFGLGLAVLFVAGAYILGDKE